MRRGKLDETENLVDLYLHACGRSEVPVQFHKWACVSMIAAAVADRVWLQKFRGTRLAPNLFVFLVGPSALGKGIAISTALRYIKNIPVVNLYRGRITGPKLFDFLGKTKRDPTTGKRTVVNSKVYLVMPELSMALGSGERADTFIKVMTDLYEGSDVTIREGTRYHGDVEVLSPCTNWFAGTTIEWLRTSITKEHVESGFFGRTVTVEQAYNLDERIFEPEYPPDVDRVVAHLQARVEALAQLEGEFAKTADARELEEQWYMYRPAPADDLLIPAWKREHDTVLKLAMIYSLADGYDLVIEKRHMEAAQRLSARVQRREAEMARYSGQRADTEVLRSVTYVIQKARRIQHSVLLKKTGVTAERMKEAIDTLLQSRRIARVSGVRGGYVYQWTDTRKMPGDDATEEGT